MRVPSPGDPPQSSQPAAPWARRSSTTCSHQRPTSRQWRQLGVHHTTCGHQQMAAWAAHHRGWGASPAAQWWCVSQWTAAQAGGPLSCRQPEGRPRREQLAVGRLVSIGWRVAQEYVIAMDTVCWPVCWMHCFLLVPPLVLLPAIPHRLWGCWWYAGGTVSRQPRRRSARGDGRGQPGLHGGCGGHGAGPRGSAAGCGRTAHSWRPPAGAAACAQGELAAGW